MKKVSKIVLSVFVGIAFLVGIVVISVQAIEDAEQRHKTEDIAKKQQAKEDQMPVEFETGEPIIYSVDISFYERWAIVWWGYEGAQVFPSEEIESYSTTFRITPEGEILFDDSDSDSVKIEDEDLREKVINAVRVRLENE